MKPSHNTAPGPCSGKVVFDFSTYRPTSMTRSKCHVSPWWIQVQNVAVTEFPPYLSLYTVQFIGSWSMRQYPRCMLIPSGGNHSEHMYRPIWNLSSFHNGFANKVKGTEGSCFFQDAGSMIVASFSCQAHIQPWDILAADQHRKSLHAKVTQDHYCTFLLLVS